MKKDKTRLRHIMVLWAIMGMTYYAIEGIWGINSNGGWANIFMLPIGGLCGILAGGLNQNKHFYRLKMIWQSFFGAIIVLIAEFASGLILNIWLNMNIWDYSDLPFNIMGQICLLYGILWFLMMPAVIWAEDMLRFYLWGEGHEYSFKENYIELLSYK